MERGEKPEAAPVLVKLMKAQRRKGASQSFPSFLVSTLTRVPFAATTTESRNSQKRQRSHLFALAGQRNDNEVPHDTPVLSDTLRLLLDFRFDFIFPLRPPAQLSASPSSSAQASGHQTRS